MVSTFTDGKLSGEHHVHVDLLALIIALDGEGADGMVDHYFRYN